MGGLWREGGEATKGRDYLGTCYNSTTRAHSLCNRGLLRMVEQKAGLPPIQPEPLSEVANKDDNTQLSDTKATRDLELRVIISPHYGL